MTIVLDNSVVMLWLIPNSNPSGIKLAQKLILDLQEGGALMPSIWPLEAANVIAKCERKGLVTIAQSTAFLSLLNALKITLDEAATTHALTSILDTARLCGLSSYDAAYLELALRKKLPLATLDAKLCAAAKACGVALIEA